MRMTRADFGLVAGQKPIRLNDPLISLAFYPNALNTKVSAVASKKNTKKAVGRHFIKRYVYQAFSSFSAKKQGWYVFFVRSNGVIPNPTHITSAVQNLMKKV